MLVVSSQNVTAPGERIARHPACMWSMCDHSPWLLTVFGRAEPTIRDAAAADDDDHVMSWIAHHCVQSNYHNCFQQGLCLTRRIIGLQKYQHMLCIQFVIDVSAEADFTFNHIPFKWNICIVRIHTLRAASGGFHIHADFWNIINHNLNHWIAQSFTVNIDTKMMEKFPTPGRDGLERPADDDFQYFAHIAYHIPWQNCHGLLNVRFHTDSRTMHTDNKKEIIIFRQPVQTIDKH